MPPVLPKLATDAASSAVVAAVAQAAANDLVADLARKPWWRSRTLIVNVVVLVLAGAEAQLQVLQPLLPVNFYALVAFALPLINTALRLVTSQPIGSVGAAQQQAPGA